MIMEISDKLDRVAVLRLIMKSLVEFHCLLGRKNMPDDIATSLTVDVSEVFSQNLINECGFTLDEIKSMIHEEQSRHIQEAHGATEEEALKFLAKDKTEDKSLFSSLN